MQKHAPTFKAIMICREALLRVRFDDNAIFHPSYRRVSNRHKNRVPTNRLKPKRAIVSGSPVA
jgi:hypothetical protein